MMTFCRLGVSALALIAAPVAAQQAAFDAARIAQHVKTLSDDSYEGRAPATRGETMTVVPGRWSAGSW